MSNSKSIMVYDRNSRYINLGIGEKFTRSVIRLLKHLQLNRPEYASELLRLVFPLLKNLKCPDVPFHVTHFGPLHLIGKGGYGAVYKATHVIDGIPYAIKVIGKLRTLEELELARSEVAVISRLSHENVVRYITSWIEPGALIHGATASSSGNTSNTGCYSSYRSSGLRISTRSSSPFSVDSDHPSSVVSSQSSTTDTNEISERGTPTVITPHRIHSTFEQKQNYLKQRHSRNNTAGSSSWKPKIFIQMEWCQSNLAKWLTLRNAQQLLSDIVPAVPHAPVRWLMDQIARGVAYLHSEGILHRDLKPENILLQGPPLHQIVDAPCDCIPSRMQAQSPTTGCRACETIADGSQSKQPCYHHLTVKICDFGLTAVICRTRLKHVPALSYTPKSLVDYQNRTRRHSADSCRQRPIAISLPQDHLRYSCRQPKSNPRPNVSSPVNWLATNGQGNANGATPLCLLTANLGSTLYTAPEVKTDLGVNQTIKLAYGYKADIFSLGVVFLQMLYVFATLHELIALLQQLALNATPEILLPLAMCHSWPHESHLIAQMLSPSADLRPRADQLLASLSFTSEFPDLVEFPEASRYAAVKHQLTLPPPPPLNCDTGANNSGLPMNTTTTLTTHAPQFLISPPDNCYSTNRFIDSLLWHIRSLEQELVDTRRRLARYEPI